MSQVKQGRGWVCWEVVNILPGEDNEILPKYSSKHAVSFSAVSLYNQLMYPSMYYLLNYRYMKHTIIVRIKQDLH